ncbi:L-amino acid oxidase [Mycena amicta]|nr:L-amino acid oxidase [Mycena amicta]
MAYTRPSLSAARGNRVSVSVPKGWFTTIRAVTRRTYNQLVVVGYDFYGDTEVRHLANSWGSPNPEMHDLDTGRNYLSFIPDDRDMKITIAFHYSETEISSNTLASAPYASQKFQSFISSRPEDAPEEIPDYMTIMLFVQDAADSAQPNRQPQFDDLVLTISMAYGSPIIAPPPVVETGTRALTMQSTQAVIEYLNRFLRPGEPLPGPPPPYQTQPELENLVVGVLGAGVSGLYIGMILDSLDIKYEIMEGSGRIGGRLYTHRFPKKQGQYQYYDVGAMRFPDTTFMHRTFDLVRKHLDMPEAFIPYVRKQDNAFLCYNDISVTRGTAAATPNEDDIFKVSKANGGSIPLGHVAKGSGALWDEALKELRDNFKNLEFADAYKKLMEYDGYSVSGYLQQVKGYSADVISWFQMTESRTGLMDAALTETVLASLVFNDPKFENKTINWYCLDGGSEIVHEAMTERLSSTPVLYHRATVIEQTHGGDSITVTFDRRLDPNRSSQSVTKRTYSNVISTMSFACLRMVDLTKAGLNQGQKNAIRDLIYTPSIKVGMQFKTAWWERLGIVGGQSSTDLPIRDAVYPSYGPDSSHGRAGIDQKSNCMIVSYNGMQDSQRLGGLMHGRGTPEEHVLLDLIMNNLAQLHGVDVQMLWNEFEDYHPWDFYRDSFQLGAFCQFGPTQFKNIYPYMQQPASEQQRLHFAGDATSTFHGWVAGALNSAWRAVRGLLISHPELNPNPDEDILEKFQEKWGSSEELDENTLATIVNIGRSTSGKSASEITARSNTYVGVCGVRSSGSPL